MTVYTTHTLPFGDVLTTTSRMRWLLIRQDTPVSKLRIVHRSHYAAPLSRFYVAGTDYLLDQKTGRVIYHHDGQQRESYCQEVYDQMLSERPKPDPVMLALAVAARGPIDPHPEVEVYEQSAWDRPPSVWGAPYVEEMDPWGDGEPKWWCLQCRKHETSEHSLQAHLATCPAVKAEQQRWDAYQARLDGDE